MWNCTETTIKTYGFQIITIQGQQYKLDCCFQIGRCQRLGVLSLRDNRIMYLPPEVGNLKELHVLDVSGNRYTLGLTFKQVSHGLIAQLSHV